MTNKCENLFKKQVETANSLIGAKNETNTEKVSKPSLHSKKEMRSERLPALVPPTIFYALQLINNDLKISKNEMVNVALTELLQKEFPHYLERAKEEI